MNTELLSRLGDLAVSCITVMAFIVLACLVTPKIAKWIEKKNPELAEKIENNGLGAESPERVNESAKGRNPDDYEAHSAFEASKLDDFDPNYKIYNTDIYGVDFKNGKKQKNG